MYGSITEEGLKNNCTIFAKQLSKYKEIIPLVSGITNVVNQNPDLLITPPKIDENKLRFVVASGNSPVTREEIIQRVTDFKNMYPLPFKGLGTINVTDLDKKS